MIKCGFMAEKSILSSSWGATASKNEGMWEISAATQSAAQRKRSARAQKRTEKRWKVQGSPSALCGSLKEWWGVGHYQVDKRWAATSTAGRNVHKEAKSKMNRNSISGMFNTMLLAWVYEFVAKVGKARVNCWSGLRWIQFQAGILC